MKILSKEDGVHHMQRESWKEQKDSSKKDAIKVMGEKGLSFLFCDFIYDYYHAWLLVDILYLACVVGILIY